MLEAGAINPDISYRIGLSGKSTLESGSAAESEFYLASIVPLLAFFCKLGINMAFQGAYLGSFSNEAMFPINKRATAIGICNFVARLLTIFSFMVAELKKPGPAIYLVVVTFIALLVCFTLPSKE